MNNRIITAVFVVLLITFIYAQEQTIVNDDSFSQQLSDAFTNIREKILNAGDIPEYIKDKVKSPNSVDVKDAMKSAASEAKKADDLLSKINARISEIEGNPQKVIEETTEGFDYDEYFERLLSDI